MHVLVASIDNQQFAFDLTLVERTLFAVELTPLPNAPDYILGAINMHGTLLSVFNLRALLDLPARPLSADDHFVCVGDERPAALWVDRVVRVWQISDKELVPSDQFVSEIPYVQGAFTLEDHLVLLINLSAVLEQARTGEVLCK